jgi:hypothetical protein
MSSQDESWDSESPSISDSDRSDVPESDAVVNDDVNNTLLQDSKTQSNASLRQAREGLDSGQRRKKRRAAEDDDDADQDGFLTRPLRRSFACPFLKNDPVKHGSCLTSASLLTDW